MYGDTRHGDFCTTVWLDFHPRSPHHTESLLITCSLTTSQAPLPPWVSFILRSFLSGTGKSRKQFLKCRQSWRAQEEEGCLLAWTYPAVWMSRKPLPSVIDFFYLYGIPNHSFDWQTRTVFESQRLCEETPDTHAVTHRKLIGLFPGPTTVTGSTDSEKWKNHSFPAWKQTPPSLPELWNSKSTLQNSWMGWETPLCLGEARWDTEIKGRKERGRKGSTIILHPWGKWNMAALAALGLHPHQCQGQNLFISIDFSSCLFLHFSSLCFPLWL